MDSGAQTVAVLAVLSLGAAGCPQLLNNDWHVDPDVQLPGDATTTETGTPDDIRDAVSEGNLSEGAQSPDSGDSSMPNDGGDATMPVGASDAAASLDVLETGFADADATSWGPPATSDAGDTSPDGDSTGVEDAGFERIPGYR